MKLSVNRAQIIYGLQKAGSVIPAKAGAAYLRSIWLKCDESHLSIMTTDASIEFTGTYAAEVAEPGLVGVAGRTLVDLIRQFPPGMIEMSVENGSENFIIKQGKRGRYTLPVYSSEWFQAFSPFPEEEPVVWSGDFLTETIDRISFCIDDEEAREAMSCLCFKPRGNGRIDACGMNGHQFAMVTFVHDDLCARLPENGLLINKKYMTDIKKWLSPDEIELNLSDKRLFLKGNQGTEMLSVERTNNYEYPDYNLFLSKLEEPGQGLLEVQRKAFIEALKRIMCFSTDSGQAYVTMSLSPTELNLAVKGSDGSANEIIPVDYNGELDSIAFPTKDLIEIAGHFTSEIITMKFTGKEGPCGITGADDNGYTVILMPMRVADESYYKEETD